MKKFALILAALLLTMTCAMADELVDTYTSASLTKSYVEGEEAAALAEVLTASGADIATTKQANEPGYEKMYGMHAFSFFSKSAYLLFKPRGGLR